MAKMEKKETQIVTNDAKRRLSNVEFPKKDTQRYFPWTEIGDGMTEYDAICKVIDYKLANGGKVTLIFYFSPPGMGKTVLGYFLAKEYGIKPVQVVNCNSSMDSFSLLGTNSTDGSESGMIWEDGPIPAIIRATNDHGIGFLVLNEYNALLPDVQIAFNSLLDGQDKVVLTEHNNESVKIEDGKHLVIIASGNPKFLGTSELQGSVRDRVNVWVNLERPSKTKEAALLRKLRGIDIDLANKMANFAQQMRTAHYDTHVLPQSVSPRALLNWIDVGRALGSLQAAFNVTVLRQFTDNGDAKQVKFLTEEAKNAQMHTWKLPKSQEEIEKEKEKREKEIAKINKTREKRNGLTSVGDKIKEELGV